MVHSRSHKSHFKLKVRHIIERLIRKFGFDAVEELIPEADRKLIANIKKRKQRSKRKKTTEKSFEDVLNGSDSEEEGEEDVSSMAPEFSSLSSKVKKNAELMIDDRDGDIVDLLSNAAISKLSLKNQKKSQQKKKRIEDEFKSKDGKLVFEESEEEDGPVQEDFFKQAMQGGDEPFERLPNGKIKFLKRKRGDEVEVADSEDEKEDLKAKKAKRKEEEQLGRMLGKQFKAKVEIFLIKP